jgi:FkbM family methyltransferase
MHFREGTEDEKIFRLAAKEYGELDFEGKTVLDIGAHVGGFSFHAASSGAARVVAFEAGSDNFALLQRNCAAPNIECRHAAVWNVAGELTWGPGGFGGDPVVNTGGGGVMAPGDEKVTAVAFDDVVRELGRVDILKIDAEGSLEAPRPGRANRRRVPPRASPVAAGGLFTTRTCGCQTLEA